MQQEIVEYLQDEERHWIAVLACGHKQHLKHKPPWRVCEWVQNETERLSRVGTPLDCAICGDRAAD